MAEFMDVRIIMDRKNELVEYEYICGWENRKKEMNKCSSIFKNLLFLSNLFVSIHPFKLSQSVP